MTDTENYGILDLAFLQIYFDEPSDVYKREKLKSMLSEPSEEETKSCMEKRGTYTHTITCPMGIVFMMLLKLAQRLYFEPLYTCFEKFMM